MTQYSDFANELLRNMAGQMGLSYEQVVAQMYAPPKVRREVIRLMLTDDPRRWKRAWRIYLGDNGPGASRVYLMGIVGEHRDARARAAWHRGVNRMFEEWAAKNGLLPTKDGAA